MTGGRILLLALLASGGVALSAISAADARPDALACPEPPGRRATPTGDARQGQPRAASTRRSAPPASARRARRHTGPGAFRRSPVESDARGCSASACRC